MYDSCFLGDFAHTGGSERTWLGGQQGIGVGGAGYEGEHDDAPSPSADPRRDAPLTWWTKAVIDVVLGSILALLTLPIVVIAALVSAVVFRAWPFVAQERVGYRGRAFRCLKVRSLPARVPPAIDKYALAGYPIPRWGRFLRGTHIDELPQLWLLPVRRMSLVGPRPEMPQILHRYPADLVAVRERVLPGCTGLWQISEDARRMIYESPEYDIEYVERFSLGLDLWIMWRTVVALPGGSRMTRAQVLRHGPAPCGLEAAGDEG